MPGDEIECGPVLLALAPRFENNGSLLRRMLEMLAGPHVQAVIAEMFTQTKLDLARLEVAAGLCPR